MGFPAFAPIISNAFDSFHGLPEIELIGGGELLIQQGSKVESVFLLRSGLVKLTYVFPNGRETSLGLRSSGSCLGAVWALMGMPSLYSVTAITPCRVSSIPAADFPMKLIQNGRLMRHFLSTLCNESMSQSASQVQVMGSSAEGRLKHFMCERESTHLNVKTLDTLPLLKQMELAQLLAIAPEHLSRLMRKLSTDDESNFADKDKKMA
jgi:CRP/FNR family transcriptional regulator